MFGTLHALHVVRRLREARQALALGADRMLIAEALGACLADAELWVVYGRAVVDEAYARQLLEEENAHG